MCGLDTAKFERSSPVTDRLVTQIYLTPKRYIFRLSRLRTSCVRKKLAKLVGAHCRVNASKGWSEKITMTARVATIDAIAVLSLPLYSLLLALSSLFLSNKNKHVL